jgi:hypothetical protein
MKKPVTMVYLVGMGLSTLSMADCPPSLSAEQTVECINYEGATSSYLDYKDDAAEKVTDKVADKESTTEISHFATVESKE